MTQNIDRIRITTPDDWHIHLRDGNALKLTVPHVAEHFQRAIVMPNLVPPVLSGHDAMAYKERILAELPADKEFTPLMVLYLTDKTTPELIREAAEMGVIACKLYPAGATTNSDSGVTDISKIYPAIEAMQACGMKLLIHGEVTDNHIDIFEREARFIDRTMVKLVERFPQLRVVFEHITTSDAVDFVSAASANIAATITAHHLLFNRNHMLAGGIRPHYYCLPILKHGSHQESLVKAATSGSPKFFMGTDSAPHVRSQKESDCGCAGAYTSFHALPLYAESFDGAGKLDKLEGFASFFGPDFYGLPRNSGHVELERKSWTVPEHFDYLGEQLKPLCAGETLQWQVNAA